MNLHVMKVFCDLVQSGSFSRAAEMNYISQSAVSQQLAKLERQLDTQLVSRGGGMVATTDAGRALYRGAKDILRRHEEMIDQVRAAANALSEVLRVGTIYSVGFYLLDPYVRRFIRNHPEVNLHVEYTRWNRIHAAVANGDMDLGVVACPDKHRAIEAMNLADEKLAVVCSPEDELARRKKVTPAELAGRKFVAFEDNIPTRRHIDRLLKLSRVSVDVVMAFDNIELLKRAIGVGSGIGILPRANVQAEVGHGDLACVEIDDGHKWVRPIAIIKRRGRTPDEAEKLFLSMLRGKE